MSYLNNVNSLTTGLALFEWKVVLLFHLVHTVVNVRVMLTHNMLMRQITCPVSYEGMSSLQQL